MKHWTQSICYAVCAGQLTFIWLTLYPTLRVEANQRIWTEVFGPILIERRRSEKKKRHMASVSYPGSTADLLYAIRKLLRSSDLQFSDL
jgi:hypothetical protein